MATRGFGAVAMVLAMVVAIRYRVGEYVFELVAFWIAVPLPVTTPNQIAPLFGAFGLVEVLSDLVPGSEVKSADVLRDFPVLKEPNRHFASQVYG
jgi:hypothetical protein